MGRVISDYLEAALGAFVLITFLYLSFHSFRVIENSIISKKEIEAASNPVVYQTKKESDYSNVVIDKNELISNLMQYLDYPVNIDGLVIKPEDYFYVNFDYSVIKDGNYRVTYQYNDDGSIKMVFYTSQ